MSERSEKTSKKTLVLATANQAKADELNRLLQSERWQVITFRQISGDADIEETGTTLDENAGIKAHFVRKKTGLPVLADDTGLEVDLLDGRPGVFSARFAGPDADDVENRKRLIRELSHTSDPARRTARFRTVLVYIDDHGVRKYEGTCEGYILEEERGTGGFGYDPLFCPAGYDKTFAEMDPAEKNRISHRGKALRKFLKDLNSG